MGRTRRRSSSPRPSISSDRSSNALTDLRVDELTGRRVAIAPGRAKRPGAARPPLEEPTPDELATCPFCVGHEDMTPPETLVLPEAGDWRVRVVPNLYPALARQEVVVHSPGHARSIAQLGNDQLDLVAEAWQRRRASEPEGYLQALINEGRAAGSSLAHTHSQLAWLDSPPGPEPDRDGEIVAEQEGLVAWCPRVSRVAYETAIAPRDAEAGGAFTSPRLGAALRLLADIVRRLHALEGPTPFNAWVNDADTGWRIVLFPRLSVLAALELGAGVYINTLAPETAAERLRG